MKKLRIIRNILAIILIIEATLFILFYLIVVIYSKESYKAIDIDSYTKSSDNVKVEYIDNYIYFSPNNDINKNKGVIFYPGGLVDYMAYTELLYNLALDGYYGALFKMPYNLAFFGKNNANKILNNYNDINWYIGGHSLGGVSAASYYSSNMNRLNGLFLLASYSTHDIKDGNVLSIYGSNDKVLNMESYNKYKINLPTNTTFYEIDGGIHSYFGSYGIQKGDGTPTISKEEQIDITIKKLALFMD